MKNSKSILAIMFMAVIAAIACVAFPLPVAAGVSIAMAPVGMPAFSARTRAVYQFIQDNYGGGDDLIATQSYLRVEQTLSNNASQYTFDIVDNGNAMPTEVKLQKNDVFIVTHLAAYFIQYPASGGAITKYTGILNTYPNASEFTGPTTPRDINAFYNGYLSISVGRVKFFDKYPASLLFRAAVTQQASASTYSDRELADGAASIEPLCVLSGSATNLIQWTIPVGTTALAVADQGATSVTKVVFHPFGFLVSNAANYVKS